MKIGPKQVPNAISQLLEGVTQKIYIQEYLHFPENHFLENKNSPGLFLMSDLTIENSEVVVLSDIFHANSTKDYKLNRPNDFSQTLAK